VVFDDPAQGVAVLNVGRGSSLTVWELEPNEARPSLGDSVSFPVFDSPDAAAQRDELIARGVSTSVLRDVPGSRCFSLWDLDGNRLEACEVLEPGRG